jgi:ESX secretion-associated protein EspJ
MGPGIGQPAPLKVDPEQLGRLGNQLLSAAGDLPEVPLPFMVTGTDALSAAIACRLPSIEGPIHDALPKLKNEAATIATNVVTAAAKYASTDAQLAADCVVAGHPPD